ncbi:MAG: TonB-dependent receptor [Porphyrobacter sp.]|nr:TonB-dependent receptor [Porphyrobacter sp.]
MRAVLRTAGLSASILALTVAAPSQAEVLPADRSADAAATGADTDAPPREGEGGEIVVSATIARDRLDVASPVSILNDTDLLRAARPQIGDTIARVPGVSAATFGPNASRPVLRGLTGERVRVLTDGIGAFDVSNTSADHAVAIDPLTAERIEVVRGPAALRFGPSAVGGVVNVLDSRIPTRIPDNAVAADIVAGVASAARERNVAAGVTARLTPELALRVGGNLLETGDLRTGGFILGPRLRQQASASGDLEVRALASLRGRIPNSDASQTTGTVGLSYISGEDTLGVAVSRLETTYAVPPRFDVVNGVPPEEVFLDAHQTRYDLRGSIGIGDGVIERIDLRAGYADYAHVEGGADPGDVGTRFANKGLEVRLEATQAKRGSWVGAIGGQYVRRDFEAIGEEAFVPPNLTEDIGLFTVQGIEAGPLRFEAGVRFDHRRITSPTRGFDRSFSKVSGSLGAVWRVAEEWRVVGNVSTTARPPAAEELLANGPHVGTQAFEVGDPTLGIERGNGGEIGLRGRGEGWRLELSAYATRFNNFIYQIETGNIVEDLPEFRFVSNPARLWGFELDAGMDLATIGGVEISSALVADLVRVNIRNQGPAPRIPPARILGELAARGTTLTGRAEVEHVFAQNRISALETPTDSFTLVNLSLDWQPFAERFPGLNLSLQANNLFDVEARRHASLLKDFAPMPGRDLRLSLRWKL